MSEPLSLEQSYLTLVEFLMLSKKRLLELGAEHNLSGMQMITVLLLENPRPMGNFKHIFNCDASNVTGIIDGLEEKQLVKRYEVNSDRRVKMVKLLARGNRIRSTVLSKLASADDSILSSLSPDEVQNFIELVQKITDNRKLITSKDER